MSRPIVGPPLCRAALVSSVAALSAACSQTSNTPVRPLASDRSTGGAVVNREIFSESDYGVSSPRVAGPSSAIPKGGGTYKLGSPYKIAGRWYVPREDPRYDRQGRASWYGDDFHGRKTANGEIFDARALTAAHPTLPLPSYAYVTNLANGRTVLVRVNDRGPYANDRILDMSHAAARALGYDGHGLADVRIRYAGIAPLNGDDRRERQFLAEQPWSRGSNGIAFRSVRPQNAPLALAEPFPAGTPGRWSPAGYRAALAGKDVPDTPVKYTRVAALEPTAVAPLPVSLRDSAPALRAGSGRAYVQVGIFRDRNNAERLRRDLGSLGPIEVSPLGSSGAGGDVFRVRIGPMTEAEASTTVLKVAARGVPGSRVVAD